MPLIKSKSKEAFQQNLKAEIGAGKPMKQSLAIAYSTKRAAGKKKYAKGGEVNEDLDPMYEPVEEGAAEGMTHLPIDKQEYDEIQDPKEHQAMASRVGIPESHMPDMDVVEMVHKIMQNKRDQMMSDDKMIYASDGIEVPDKDRKMYQMEKGAGIQKPYDQPTDYNEKIKSFFGVGDDKKPSQAGYWEGGEIPEEERSTYPKPDFVNSFRKDPDFMSEDAYMNDYMDHEKDSDDDKKKKMLSGIMAQIHAENYGRNK